MYSDDFLLVFSDSLARDGYSEEAHLDFINTFLYKKKSRSKNDDVNHSVFASIFNSFGVPSNHRIFSFVCMCYQSIQAVNLEPKIDLNSRYSEVLVLLDDLPDRNHIRFNKTHAYFSLQAAYAQFLICYSEWEDFYVLVDSVCEYIFDLDLDSVQPCFLLTYPNILRFLFLGALINFFNCQYILRMSSRTIQLFKFASFFSKEGSIKSFWEFCYSNRDIMILLDVFRKNKENGGLCEKDYSVYIENFPSSVFHVKSDAKDHLREIIRNEFVPYIRFNFNDV